MAEEENREPEEKDKNEENEEPSMESILGSIRQILSDDEEETVADQPISDSEQEASVETEASNEEAQDTVGEQAVQEPPAETPAAAPAEPEDAVPAPDNQAASNPPESEQQSEAEVSGVASEEDSSDIVDSDDAEVAGSDEGFLELTQQMIAPSPSDVDAGAPILSGPTQSASTDPLHELAKALLNRRDIAIGSRDMTLEGLIREILRPLLKEWLDDNLPYLIERLVKKEIDHMVNRAERLDL
ncbi:MAG: DUF2497 domain-containing protein [Pseudomonadota bacterium]|nr:DUF2497 domain-containing protein [Pseudomonadota bacterium]